MTAKNERTAHVFSIKPIIFNVLNNKTFLLILSAGIVMAITINPQSAVTRKNLYQGMELAVILELVAVFHLLCTAVKNWERTPSSDRYIALCPAVLFAVFYVVGRSYALKGSCRGLFASPKSLIESAIMLAGFGVIFYTGTLALWKMMDTPSGGGYGKKRLREKGLLSSYCRFLQARPFITSVITMLIFLSGKFVLSYPGVMMGDTRTQIVQAYNLDTFEYYRDFISETSMLTNHHPVLHTMILHECLEAGRNLFHSWNTGLFLYCLIQVLILVLCEAFCIQLLIRDFNLDPLHGMYILLYFGFYPGIRNMVTVITKDVIYAAMFLVFFIISMKLIMGKWRKQDYVLWCTSAIFMMLFRNDGVYILLPTVFTMMACRNIRKFMVPAFVIFTAFFLLWNHVALPALQVTPGGKQESLSVPLMQTARYYRDHGEEVTEEENAVIDRIVVADELAERYDPQSVDTIKADLRRATDRDFENYRRVWFEMFKKHPFCYLQAFLDMNYGYVYPGYRPMAYYSYRLGEEKMELVNEAGSQLGMDFAFPKQTEGLRKMSDACRDKSKTRPLLNLIHKVSPHIWIGILLFFQPLRRREWKKIILYVPLFMQFLLFLAGPVNGYYLRYLLPVLIVLPVLFGIGKSDMLVTG